MRRLASVCLVSVCMLVGGPIVALAQDAPNVDALQKELADARNQLKAAQDRKNELATENEKLKAQIGAMQKDLDAATREQMTWAEATYTMRVREAAWNAFIDHYPQLKARWTLFFEIGPLEVINDMPTWGNPALAAATQPTTLPATTTAATTATAMTVTTPSTTTATVPSTTNAPATPATAPAPTTTSQPTK